VTNIWYLDTSVIFGVITGRSLAARHWFEQVDQAGDYFLSSKLLEVEVRHQVQNLSGNHEFADYYLGMVALISIDNLLMDEAIVIPGVIGGADSIHLASLLRVREGNPVLVTHDRQMAHAAKALAIKVFDPVTDDPNCPPVA